MTVEIVLLDSKRHQRENFDCGVESLNGYIKKIASQDLKRKAATVFVSIDSSTQNVTAYYTLSSFSLELTEIEPRLTKKLPRYPLLPATMLGRLAVDKQYKGRGLGQLMLVDAMKKSYQASQQIASVALIVEAIDEGAVSFYQKFGFINFQSSQERLYLPMKTIEKITT
ncbi:GNAT family N-acetyltransferase [Waterburya agarophytonicola K14]|uniref:GNAT family N-acetyltransferase n=1 Tax=Waterburya agarophytonicola KI4 TaxID=2874699 RepID=A0A964FII4_9CYAN|nr:GNAT family N-acetyltransferase [Waterburya agarophytonicola]MCC0179891.1 GNAT family N-acetyltransferase [Waterburya agarophytonicola KI4]